MCSSDLFLLLNAMTGKDPSQLDPSIKTSSYLSIMPTLNPVAAPPPAPGVPNTGSTGQTGSGGGVNSQPQPDDPPVANDPGSAATAGNGSPATQGSFTNGCSMSMASSSADLSGVLVLALAFGLVLMVRRRWA